MQTKDYLCYTVILSHKKANDLIIIINFIALEALNILTCLMNLAVG